MDSSLEAIEIANAIERVCQGKDTASVFVALSMVLGASAAMAERPDFDGFMEIIKKGARAGFDRTMSEVR